MGSIKEEAQAYESHKTKNIADLEQVSTDFQLEDREGKDNDGVTFKYKVIVVNGEDYRVPGIVLANLKAILEDNPNLTKFKVKKSGTGLETKYTVIPLS